MDKKRRSTEIVTNGNSSEETNTDSGIDREYFEEFFTAIYNANINERAMTDFFLYLPSRKVTFTHRFFNDCSNYYCFSSIQIII